MPRPTTPPQLDPGYPSDGTDPLEPAVLLAAEVAQRRETGFDVDEVVRAANRTDPRDRAAVLALVDRMEAADRTSPWPYEEPDDLPAIRASLGTLPPPVPVEAGEVRDRIRAAWLGRIAGCNLGKPIELGTHWTVDHIRDYLELAGAYPLRDYVPVLDPMPERFVLRECWPETTLGNVDGAARDDDIDYTILALHLLEKHGAHLTTQDVGRAWLALLPLSQVFTAERAAYINLTNGIAPPRAATFRNPFREWIGAQIRGDVYGYVRPGDPWGAAELSFRDASLSHVGNGIYGEMWAAGLVAAAFTAADARDAVTTSLTVVPPASRLSAALRDVVGLFDRGLTWEDALDHIGKNYGHYHWVHTVNNAAVLAAGLLWGEGDVTTTLGRTVMGGWDTDSNGATAGSVAAILAGTAGLPAHLVDPLHDRTRSALFGFDNVRISDLAERTFRLAALTPG